MPPLPTKLPLLEEAAVPVAGAGVAYLSDPFDDVGGLSKTVVSFVLQVVGQSKSNQKRIEEALRYFTDMNVVSPS